MGLSKTAILNRYTTLPILLDMLQQRHVTLLSPETWEDRNDAYFLEQYRLASELQSVLAVCFSERGETFHHWRIFSSGSSGVCIEFDKKRLLNGFAGLDGFRHKAVTYRLIQDLNRNKPELSSWPFLKRKPFKDEQEYRIIFESATENLRSKSVAMDLTSIRRVTLSPWLPTTIAPAIKTVLRCIEGCGHIEVRSSSLIDNAKWRAAITLDERDG